LGVRGDHLRHLTKWIGDMRGVRQRTQEKNPMVTRAARHAIHDPHAIELLYDQNGGLAFALAYRILGERSIAEDVVQEAFLNIWRQGTIYDAERGSARSWVLTIVHHRAIDQIRSMRVRTRADTEIKDAAPLVSHEDTWASVAQGLERDRVRRAIMALPPEQEQVVKMIYYGGFTHQQVAERVGIPLGTVKGRLRLALEKLRDLLRPPEAHNAIGCAD
jgi:RNA polymerase sigma-70 factor (ECF subfamily)